MDISFKYRHYMIEIYPLFWCFYAKNIMLFMLKFSLISYQKIKSIKWQTAT
jgi:hypothetical protein